MLNNKIFITISNFIHNNYYYFLINYEKKNYNKFNEILKKLK